MTFGQYSKRQLWFEPVNGANDFIGNYTPSYAGTLKHIRLRYIITYNWTQDFTVGLRVLNNSSLIDSSNLLTLNDFTLPNAPYDFHQGWIRFDFAGNKNLSDDINYRIEIDFDADTYSTDNSNFIMFAIDYPFRTYTTTGDSDPTMNGYAELQIYLERRYDDFIER